MTLEQDQHAAADAVAPRRTFLRQFGGVGLAAAGVSTLAVDAAEPVSKKPGPRRMLIIDSLGEFSDPNLPEGERGGADMGVSARALKDLRASGLSAVNLTMGYVAGKMEPFEYSVSEVGKWDALIRRKPEYLVKVLNAQDIRDAHAQNRVGVIFGFQNAAMMGNDAGRAAVFANLGVRVVQLTYNVRNQLGDGSMVPENKGLTEFGREVVHALNTNRVLVDLSHSGERICLDAAEVSTSPIIISHTGCRALTDLPRNKTDRELRLVAEKGGYVGIYYMPFLAIDRQPTVDDLIAHIEHAVKVCGEDHVGIGSDGLVSDIDDMVSYMKEFRAEVEQRRASGIGAAGERGDIVKFLPDINGPTKYRKLADLLARRGHSQTRIEKIMGGNFLQVAGRVW
jgi:membrane dipeptidase